MECLLCARLTVHVLPVLSPSFLTGIQRGSFYNIPISQTRKLRHKELRQQV